MIKVSENISEYISTNFGNEFLTKYLEFVESKYLSTIRIGNPKIETELISSLKNQGIELKKINGLPSAFYVIKGNELIGKTVEHTLGKYYIQSLSSMIPPLVLNPTKNEIVLDLCSAPGSKSTQLSELMNYEGTIISNEPNLNRVKALIHNLDKLNSLNIRVSKEKGELLWKKFPEKFDKILVDAPCSALGVVQKKQEVSNWWNQKSVETISSLQLRLLISAIKMAKLGAEIVYSTCTLTLEENEYVIDKVIKKYPVELMNFELDIPHENGIVSNSNYTFDSSLERTKRIIPWKINSEGFFIAKLKKVESMGIDENSHAKINLDRIVLTNNSKHIKKYLLDLCNHFGIEFDLFKKYKFYKKGNDINFSNNDSAEFESKYFFRIGTKFGIIDRNNKIKLHSHAAQIIGCYALKNIVELNDSSSLSKYLNGSIIQNINLESGQKIVKYKNFILGTGILVNGKLKSQFPRSKRTGNIHIS